ncbi:4-hydroxy-tetrahydrodipicolinate reductase [Elusimicrobiota bacterium]
MINISVSGGMGKMGKRICHFINENPDTELVGIIEKSGHPEISAKVGNISVTENISEGIKKADIIIDFTSTENTLNLVDICAQENKKIVIGTTGFDSGQTDKLKIFAGEIAILLSPNMSIGVNLMYKMAKDITERLPAYEKEIIEAHHRQKVDSPSGTAIKLAGIIAGSEDKPVFGREGKVGPRQKNEVGIHAVRGGSIVGEHKIMWIGDNDIIELTHKAQTRDVFAQGAVQAAIWLSKKNSGRLYDMEDVLS